MDDYKWIINGEHLSRAKTRRLLDEINSPITYSGVRARLRRGANLYEALTKPLVKHRPRVKQRIASRKYCFSDESLVNMRPWV